jgi:hypothetical protein
MAKKQSKKKSSISIILDYLHENVTAINNSKIFAGLMIITLNIVSKFVNIKLSKTMESYLKFSFSRNVLVFAIAWMGTRDIYIAFFIMLLFIVCTEHLLHEDSALFILPTEFKDYHISLLENEVSNKDTVTDEEIERAKIVLEKAKQQNKVVELQGYPVP